MNQKTVSWHLHDQLSRGFISRTSHGSYRLSESIPEKNERFPHLPQLSCECYEHLLKTGYEFYLSGLDCLNGIGFTVSGNYPVIVCTPKHQVKDLQLSLMRQFDFAITEDELQLLSNTALRDRIQFVVLSTTNMSLSKDHFAFTEKAFVDLYYAATRFEYPLPISELPHILSLITPNPFRFRQSTKDRGLSNELNFLLSYNKEFLKAMEEYI